MRSWIFAGVLCLILPGTLAAGVHISVLPFRELPADWRGFLPDHRALRLAAAANARPELPVPPLRETLADVALKLEAKQRLQPLSADELADLGGLYLRLGAPEKAVEILRPAARQHPEHFQIAANLGTAWQMLGDLESALLVLDEAVRLAPETCREFEQYHRKLVKLRLAEGRLAQNFRSVDDLFSCRYVGKSGQPEAGGIAATEREKLPENAVAIVQQLALWLPNDGRLLWQLGELANASGDIRTAANILDGCVTELGIKSEELRARRLLYRQASEAQRFQEDHQRHRNTVRFRSARPLVRSFDPGRLPAIVPDGINPLPWPALSETDLTRGFPPQVLPHVAKLAGKRVSLSGYMTPASGNDAELSGFLLTEYPIGCWFCESPTPTQMVKVELTSGVTAEFARGRVKVVGIFHLNRTDPEQFLFTLSDATIGPVD
jgi:hypothetical protein